MTFDVRNSGRVAGAVVPQVYVGPGPAIDGVQQAVRSLRGFRPRLPRAGTGKAGDRSALDQRSFQYWSESGQRWVTNYGNRTIFVGEADALQSLPLSATVKLIERNQ